MVDGYQSLGWEENLIVRIVHKYLLVFDREVWGWKEGVVVVM